jgi:Predicted O-methyltransferase
MKNYLDKLLLILVNNWRKHQIKRVVLQQEIPGIEACNKEQLVCISKDFVSKNFTQTPLQIDLEIIKNIFIRLDDDERFFEFTRFQAGGLDDEIVVIYFLMQLAKSQKILEIGVANGYSSAFLGDHAVRNNATYFQIDLPRFETTPKRI